MKVGAENVEVWIERSSQEQFRGCREWCENVRVATERGRERLAREKVAD